MKAILTFTIKALGFTMLLALLVSISTAQAQADALAPVNISLVADKISYGPTDPVKVQVVVYNDQADDILDVIADIFGAAAGVCLYKLWFLRKIKADAEIQMS